MTGKYEPYYECFYPEERKWEREEMKARSRALDRKAKRLLSKWSHNKRK